MNGMIRPQFSRFIVLDDHDFKHAAIQECVLVFLVAIKKLITVARSTFLDAKFVIRLLSALVLELYKSATSA